MVRSRVNWHGKEAFGAILEAAWQMILRATVLFWTELQTVLSLKQNPPPYVNSSRPGEPPAKRTGWLAAHTKYEQDKAHLTTRVGIQKNAIYGLFLELGTKYMDPRPWFMATLKRLLPKIQSMVGTVKVGNG